MSRTSKRPVGLRGAADAYRRLHRETGVSVDVLRLAGVEPHASAEAAVAAVKRRAGAKAWSDAERAATPLAGSNLLRSAITGRRAGGRPTTRTGRYVERQGFQEYRTEDDDADLEPCDRPGCGHAAAMHANGDGACGVTECDCESYVIAGDDKPAPPSSRRNPAAPPPESPEERAQLDVMMARPGNTATRAQLRAAMRGLPAQALDAPAPQRARRTSRPAQLPSRRPQRRRMSLQQAMRQPEVIAAAQRGDGDVEKYAKGWLAMQSQDRGAVRRV